MSIPASVQMPMWYKKPMEGITMCLFWILSKCYGETDVQ